MRRTPRVTLRRHEPANLRVSKHVPLRCSLAVCVWDTETTSLPYKVHVLGRILPLHYRRRGKDGPALVGVVLRASSMAPMASCGYGPQ